MFYDRNSRVLSRFHDHDVGDNLRDGADHIKFRWRRDEAARTGFSFMPGLLYLWKGREVIID